MRMQDGKRGFKVVEHAERKTVSGKDSANTEQCKEDAYERAGWLDASTKLDPWRRGIQVVEKLKICMPNAKSRKP